MDYAGVIPITFLNPMLTFPNVEILPLKSTEELVTEVQEKWPNYNIEPEYEVVEEDRVVHVPAGASMHELSKPGHVHSYKGGCLKRRLGPLCGTAILKSDDFDLGLED